jgi:hypothetical protein
MSTARVRWQVAVIAVFLLLLAVLPAYYAVHTPFSGVTNLSQPVISADPASISLACWP